jgi:arylformamidase
MSAIDYETEYNNRARVPEHPQIFAGWARDAEAYRQQRLSDKRAELGLRYGEGPRQIIDLFLANPGAAAPLALFVHGGWWRSLERESFSHMAAGLNALGVDVAVAGYDLCPNVTIAAIIDQIREACVYLWSRDGRQLLVFGHSAGGHLTAAMLATNWPAVAPKAPVHLVPAGYAISGVFDLLPLVRISVNQDLRLDEDEARRVSPACWRAPAGLILDAVVGGLESSEFLRQSRSIADLWGDAGVATRYGEIDGANHFTVLAPLTDPASAMSTRIAALAHGVAKQQSRSATQKNA